MKKILSGVALRLLPRLLTLLMRIWFGTCRVTTHNEHYCFCPDEEEKNFLATFWHYSIIYLFYYMRKYSGTVMVSSSTDGQYVARLPHELGFETVRGSRNSHGVEALKGMLRAVRRGENGAIVADGSQGPPLLAQPGAILVASRTGVPIIPMVWSASSYFTIRSWDRTALPRPFAKIDFFFGEPLQVQARLSHSEIEEYRLLLEERLNDLYLTAWSLYNKKLH